MKQNKVHIHIATKGTEMCIGNGTKNFPLCQNEVHEGLMAAKCFLLCHILPCVTL